MNISSALGGYLEMANPTRSISRHCLLSSIIAVPSDLSRISEISLISSSASFDSHFSARCNSLFLGFSTAVLYASLAGRSLRSLSHMFSITEACA